MTLSATKFVVTSSRIHHPVGNTIPLISQDLGMISLMVGCCASFKVYSDYHRVGIMMMMMMMMMMIVDESSPSVD